jgi:adenylate cyclase
MQCLSCGKDIRSEDAFCSGCGTATRPVCIACAHVNEQGSRFCSRCGDPLGQPALKPLSEISGRPRVGERKRLTVLFADVRDSTGLIEQVDPEEAMTRLSSIIELMKEAVDKFDGTVNKVQGDGVMALFGAPKPQEDHAVCACLAALAMQESLAELHQPDLKIRVGIHTGDVVVHTIDSHLSQTYDASGITVHLANRMEQMPNNAGILLTAETYKAARHMVDARSLGAFPVRGLTRTVNVYELLGRKQAPVSDQFRRASHLSKFVGRNDELAALRSELKLAQSGKGRVVSVVGEAGLGKSRLCFEFAEECRWNGINVLEARVLAHGKTTPLQPVLEIFRSFFRIRPRHSKDEARDLVLRTMSAIGGFEETVPIILEFLGLQSSGSPTAKVDPKTRKARLLRFVRRLPRATVGTPTIVLLEDLHWIDTASDEFVSALADGVADSSTLLLLNHRPEYVADWMQRSHFRSIRLSPLEAGLASDLVETILGKHLSLGSLAREITRRAQGNPFFLEELVQSIVEQEPESWTDVSRLASTTSASGLPSTVQAVVAARIDRLGERPRQMLQVAAVLGRGITSSALSKISGVQETDVEDALRQLRSTELLFEPSLSDGSVHEFRHPLIQEVAYDTLLRSRRKELHAKVAEVLEVELKDRLDESAGLIAHHLEQAGEIERSAQAHVRGAIWAGASDPAQALRSWKKVRELLKPQQSSQMTDYLLMMACGQVLNFSWREGIPATEAQPYFAEATQLAKSLGDMRANALIHAAYGRLLAASGSADEYVAKVRQAEELSASKNDPSLKVTLKAVLGHALSHAGHLADALDMNAAAMKHAHETEKFDREMLGFDIEPWLLAVRGLILVRLARAEEARILFDRVLQMDPKTIDPIQHVIPSIGYVELAWGNGDSGLASLHAERAFLLAEKSDSPYIRVYAHGCRGVAHILAERPSEAIEELRTGLEFARTRKAGLETEAKILTDLADAYRLTGDLDTALKTVDEAIEIAVARCTRVTECQARLIRARVLHDSRDSPATKKEVARVEALIQFTGAKIFEHRLVDLRNSIVRTRGTARRLHVD